MSENDRLREARISLKLSQEKFGERLGVSKVAISLIETGKNSLTDQMRKSVCREFRVNENWLLTGNGNMLDNATEDDFIDTLGLDDFGASLVREYMKLDDNQKAAVQQFFYNTVKGTSHEE